MLNILIDSLDYTLNSRSIFSQANHIYRLLPDDDYVFFNLCEGLLQNSPNYMKFISIWIKKRQLFTIEYLNTYNNWLNNYIYNWELCDQFCYRILNPTIEKNFILSKNYILNWAKSDKIFVNRAALVCMIHSSTNFDIRIPLEFVCQVIDELSCKEEKYIDSAIGWVLKYAYLVDSDYIINYILSNKFNTIILRKAKEKMNIRDKEIIKMNRDL